MNSNEILTGGEALVRGLETHGVDTVFGIPGAQIYGLFDALQKASGNIRTIGARHEQGCAYMAYGYAKATGRPGVFSVVPGPGILNTGAGLLTAWGSTAPVLCLTGQVPSDFLGRERLHLHEMRDQLGTLRHITKWAERVDHPSQAPWLVARAFQEMLSGRQGPVALEAPWEFFTRKAPAPGVAPLPLAPKPEPDPTWIAAAAKLLAGAKQPMIFVGGGALHAGESILALAEALEAPVSGLRSGKGIVSEEHALGFNMGSAGFVWPKCDVAVVIGSRFELLDIRWRWRPEGLKIIRIDIDPAEVRRLKVDVSIVADADDGARALLAALPAAGAGGGGRMAALADAKAAATAAFDEIQPQIDYLKAIRAVLPRDGFMVEEISQMGFTAWYGFPTYLPRTYVTGGHQGALGFGFPTALGVKAAHPDKAVVSVTGDGGFMFGVQELATAVQYGINLVTVVFNNKSFGNVRRDQMQGFDGRLIGSDLVNPDFVKLAESFGIAAARVTTPAELKTVLAKAIDADAPWLIEVEQPAGVETSPWKFIAPNFTGGSAGGGSPPP
jgi:acetolactate synthase-1/2/3 large subunit